jgi:hypothetical protein
MADFVDETEPTTGDVQPGVQPVAQFLSSGRDARGRFAPGHRVSLRDGSQSARSAYELAPAIAEQIAEKERGIVADLGGGDNIATVRRELITRFLQASVIADDLGANIVAHGVLTTKGRTRAAVTTYLQVLDRLHRLATAIGLERRPKPVGSVSEFVNRG